MSVSATRSSANSYTIDYAANGQYNVSSGRSSTQSGSSLATARRRGATGVAGDADGDGVVDGDALQASTLRVENRPQNQVAGQRGGSSNQGGTQAIGSASGEGASSLATMSTLNERGVNDMLGAYGLTIANGTVRSVDGMSLTGTSLAAATSFGGTPPLPDVTGPSASIGDVSRRVQLHDMSRGMQDASLAWEALSTMATTSMRDRETASQLQRAMALGKAEAKKNEIASTESQIAAERRAAAEAFTWAVVGAVAQVGIAYAGGNSAVGQAASAAAGSTIKAFGDYYTKAHGAGREADEHKLAAMRHQLMQEHFEQGMDSAKQNVEDSREHFRLAIKTIDNMIQTRGQIDSAIMRING